jgi:hypothetical protein
MKKKTTKIKAVDLTPTKDATGGRRGHRGQQNTSLSNQRDGPGVQGSRGGYGIHMVQ